MPYGMKTEVMSPPLNYLSVTLRVIFYAKNFSRGELTDRDQIWDPY